MFKLIKGELKKIFLKPGIFIVTALLVLALTISCFIFKPSRRTDTGIYIQGSTISQKYDASFGSSQSSNNLSKTTLTAKYIDTSNNIIAFYTDLLENSAVSKKQELLNKITEIEEGVFNDYRKLVILSESGNNSTNINKKNELRAQLKSELESFISLYNSYIGGNFGFYYLICSNQDKIDFDVYLNSAITKPFIESNSHSSTLQELQNIDIINSLTNYVNKFEEFIPSKESVEEAQSYLSKNIDNLSLIEADIEDMKLSASTLNKNDPDDSKILDEYLISFPKLVLKYQQSCENIYKLTQYTINASALSNLNDNEIQASYQFKDQTYTTKYTINEQKNICKYYLDTNKYAFEYANPLSLTTTSNSEENAYDFIYFALEICSIIILVYVVFIGATMITGEYASGTMKLVAIRPFSRRKILFSKLISTILIGGIFLLITFIVTYLIGGILFSLSSLPILIVFNSGAVTSTSPIVILLLLFVCKLVEIVFYAIFSLFISTICKSNAESVIIAVLVYFGSFILSVFSSNIGFLKVIPFVNTNLFSYFGSHLSSNTSNNLLATMFGRVIANDMNFFISFAIIIIFAIIIYIATSITFRKRDIK